jgi:hypothetical protein
MNSTKHVVFHLIQQTNTDPRDSLVGLILLLILIFYASEKYLLKRSTIRLYI